MVNLPAIYIANFAAVILLLILLISSRKVIHYGLFDNKLFCIMVYSAIFQALVETLTFYIDGRSESYIHTVSLVFNSLLFFNNIFFAYIWTLYADYKLFGDMDRIKKIYPFVAIPAALVAIGSVANMFTPVFFNVTADNVYQRGGGFFSSAYLLTYVMSYVYLFYGVLIIYLYRNKVNKYLFLPAIIFMLPIIIASLLQYFYYGISVLWLGTAISLASIYINVQNEVSSTDQLSGLFTRQYMNKYLHMIIKRTDFQNDIAGIMLDIDSFKKINDTYGHLVGDEAIRAAGKLLRDSVSHNGLVARYAGDEFIVILPSGGRAKMMETIKEIKANSEKFNSSGKNQYKINFSVGFCVYNHGVDTIDSFLGKLDSAMYDDKAKRKLQFVKQ